jgi:hypothetical protein
LDGISDVLVEVTAVASYSIREEPVVGGDSLLHDGRVPLPERGAALDVGEQEGDGAGRQIGHGPFPYLWRSLVCPVVARDDVAEAILEIWSADRVDTGS